MSGQVNNFRTKGKATAAITGRLAVKRSGSSDNGIAVCSAAGEEVFGAIEFDAASGDSVAVITYGDVVVTAGGTVARHDKVMTDASGKFVTATSGGKVAGYAREAGTLDNPMWVFLDPDGGSLGAAVATTAAVAADVLAIPVTARFVQKTTGADAEALTLANGTPGQRLTINLVADGGGDGTLTPATSEHFATIVFADAGDYASLEYVDDTVGWILLGHGGLTVTGAPAVTAPA